jgi:ubiquinone biosynthesis protein
MEKQNYRDIDLVKLYETFTATLVEELDFRTEVNNAQKTKQLFRDYPYVYIPEYYDKFSSERVITMEFITGAKINEKKKIE